MNTIKLELKLDNQGLADLLQSILIKGLQPQAQMVALAALEQQQLEAVQDKADEKATIGFKTGE
jgi:hypothetical protein|tara:strand:- start:714 stop:905 length:192 start_codon:yes stop_codon:yes gene_type:complete